MQSTPIKVVAVVVGIAVIASIGVVGMRFRRDFLRDGITSITTTRESSGNGREAQLFIGGNDKDEPRIVLITHHSAIAPNWNKIDPRTSWSTANPVMGLRSNARIETTYPPDPTRSGIWVDDQKWELGEDVCVVYVSERHQATRVEIAPNERDEFAEAVETVTYMHNAFEFIDKWVLPRLPPAPPGPTLEEILESLQPDARKVDRPTNGARLRDEERS